MFCDPVADVLCCLETIYPVKINGEKRAAMLYGHLLGEYRSSAKLPM
jgi:hypothetical protein